MNKYILFIFILLSSCNFTSRIHKKILVAQDYIQKQEYEKAIVEYKSILEKDPKRNIAIKINYQLGDLYSVYLSKNEESLKYYKKVLEISDDPFWLVKSEERLGEIYFTYLKKYDYSINNYKKLSNFTPKLANQDFYQFRYALSLYKNNNLELAEEEFLKISNINNHKYKTTSLYYLGLVNFNKKKWNQSLNYWQNFIKEKPNQDEMVQAKFLIANTYEILEDLKSAYNIYYSILGDYPNTEVIQNKLKSIYKRRISRKR
jgi:tetratricopeptide (TPR) repeat protein